MFTLINVMLQPGSPEKVEEKKGPVEGNGRQAQVPDGDVADQVDLSLKKEENEGFKKELPLPPPSLTLLLGLSQ